MLNQHDLAAYDHAAYYCSAACLVAAQWGEGSLLLQDALKEIDHLGEQLTRALGWLSNNATSYSTKVLWIKTIRSLIRLLEFRQPPAVLVEYVQLAIQYAEEYGAAIDGSILYNRLAGVLFRWDRVNESLEVSQQAYHTLRTQGLEEELAQAAINIGNVLIRQEKARDALLYYQEALALAQSAHLPRTESSALGSLTLAYFYLSQPHLVIEYGEQSLTAAERINDLSHIRNTLGNLANAYDHLADYRRAVDFYRRDLEISLMLGDVYAEATTRALLGNTFIRMGYYQCGEEHLLKALRQEEQFGQLHNVFFTLDHLLSLYMSYRIDERKSALYLKQYCQLAEVIDSPEIRAMVTSRKSLGLALAEEYEQALAFNDSYMAYITDQRPQDMADPLIQRASIYSQVGDFHSATDYSEQALGYLTTSTYGKGFGYWVAWQAGCICAKAGYTERAIELLKPCVAFEKTINHAELTAHQAFIRRLHSSLKPRA